LMKNGKDNVEIRYAKKRSKPLFSVLLTIEQGISRNSALSPSFKHARLPPDVVITEISTFGLADRFFIILIDRMILPPSWEERPFPIIKYMILIAYFRPFRVIKCECLTSIFPMTAKNG